MDIQLCIHTDFEELCEFIGDVPGCYAYDLCIVSDSYDSIHIVKRSNIRLVSDQEAKEFDPLAYTYLTNKEY